MAGVRGHLSTKRVHLHGVGGDCLSLHEPASAGPHLLLSSLVKVSTKASPTPMVLSIPPAMGAAPAPGYLLDRTPRAVGRGLAIDVGCQRAVPSRSPSPSLPPSRSRFVRGSRRTHAGGSCPLRNTSQGPCPHARFRYTSPNLAAEARWPQAFGTHAVERGGMRRRRPRQRRLRPQQMRRPAVTSLVAGSTRGTALRRRQLRPPAALGARAALALAVCPRPTHIRRRLFRLAAATRRGVGRSLPHPRRSRPCRPYPSASA